MPTSISSRLLEAAKVFVEAQEKLKEISDSDKTPSRELKAAAAAAKKAFEDLRTDLAGIKPADIDCDPNLKKLNQLVDNQADRQQLADTIFKQVIGPYSSKKGADSMSSLPSVLMQKIGTLGDHRSRTTIALTCSQFKGDMRKATKQVKRLKVEAIDVSSKGSLIGLLKAYPNLEKLDLSSVRYLVDDDVLKQVAKLTQLTILNLGYCNQITDLAPLAKLTQLTSLNLYGCNQITDEGLAAFRAARPDVKIIR